MGKEVCEHRLMVLDYRIDEYEYYKCVLCGAKIKFMVVVKTVTGD